MSTTSTENTTHDVEIAAETLASHVAFFALSSPQQSAYRVRASSKSPAAAVSTASAAATAAATVTEPIAPVLDCSSRAFDGPMILYGTMIGPHPLLPELGYPSVGLCGPFDQRPQEDDYGYSDLREPASTFVAGGGLRLLNNGEIAVVFYGFNLFPLTSFEVARALHAQAVGLGLSGAPVCRDHLPAEAVRLFHAPPVPNQAKGPQSEDSATSEDHVPWHRFIRALRNQQNLPPCVFRDPKLGFFAAGTLVSPSSDTGLADGSRWIERLSRALALDMTAAPFFFGPMAPHTRFLPLPKNADPSLAFQNIQARTADLLVHCRPTVVVHIGSTRRKTIIDNIVTRLKEVACHSSADEFTESDLEKLREKLFTLLLIVPLEKPKARNSQADGYLFTNGRLHFRAALDDHLHAGNHIAEPVHYTDDDAEDDFEPVCCPTLEVLKAAAVGNFETAKALLQKEVECRPAGRVCIIDLRHIKERLSDTPLLRRAFALLASSPILSPPVVVGTGDSVAGGGGNNTDGEYYADY